METILLKAGFIMVAALSLLAVHLTSKLSVKRISENESKKTVK
ncbi:MAG: hypothetical protein WCT77_06875 [Bacteroidota bacterium]|jgi:hypothetical protein